MVRDLSQLTFPGKKPDERVRGFITKYWVAEVGVFGRLISALVVWGVLAFLLLLNPFSLDIKILSVAFAVVCALIAFYMARVVLVEIMAQLLDAFVLTDQRLISFEQSGLWKKISKEQDLTQIEDVQTEQVGWVDTMFRTGKLTVANKSENIIFFLDKVYQPQIAKRLILDARDEAINHKEDELRRRDIEDIVKRTQETMKMAAGKKEEETGEEESHLVKQIEVPDLK